jgi:hypothetical protein
MMVANPRPFGNGNANDVQMMYQGAQATETCAVLETEAAQEHLERDLRVCVCELRTVAQVRAR